MGGLMGALWNTQVWLIISNFGSPELLLTGSSGSQLLKAKKLTAAARNKLLLISDLAFIISEYKTFL
jgi:hypothetical protein